METRKPSFADIYINKKFGDVIECDDCFGSGLQHRDEDFEECKRCEGKGFVRKSE